MPIPAGTTPTLGPFIDTSGALIAATTALRDAGAISMREGKLRKVNAAGDGWLEIPGHTVAAVEPTEGLFDGKLWYDTANDALMAYDGSAFAELGGGTDVTVTVSAPTDADGSDGDLHYQVLAGVVISVWFKIAGAWHEFPVPQEVALAAVRHVPHGRYRRARMMRARRPTHRGATITHQVPGSRPRRKPVLANAPRTPKREPARLRRG